MVALRIAMIGNCQVQTLSMVAKHMLGNVSVKVLDYSLEPSRDEKVRSAFADSIADCDHVFTQTALMSHTSEADLRARYGSRVVTIANFYFRGLFPDSCYVGDFVHRLDKPSSVNSLVVLDAFRRGLTEAQAIRTFDIQNFGRLGLLGAWSSSMAEMHKREANGTVDVPGAALMEEACRRYPAFLTMNHPSAPMLTEYLAAVFHAVDVPFNHVNVAGLPDPLALHDTTPIHDLVAEYYDLPYRTSQAWRINSLDGRFVPVDEYVAHCFAAYRSADPSTLLCHSPTDLIPALRADPALAYLVDPGADAPLAADVPDPGSTDVPGSSPAIAAGLLFDRHTRPLTRSLVELSHFTHKIHSFLEVADPKIERIVQSLPRSERIWTELARSISALATAQAAPTSDARRPVPPLPGRWGTMVGACAGAALAGALLGSLVAAAFRAW